MSTNFINGVTNLSKDNIFGNLPLLDPTASHSFVDDFDKYTAANWTVTETQAGATQAITNEDGGVLLITNTAADDDLVALQLEKETFKFEAGKPLFFKARFKISDVLQSDLVFGLQITDTTPLSVTDGVYFSKADGSADLAFNVVKDSIATTSSSIYTLTNDSYVTIGFYYDGKESISYGVSSDASILSFLGKVAVTNLPDNEELTISFALQNGEAVAKTMSIDYIFVSKNR